MLAPYFFPWPCSAPQVFHSRIATGDTQPISGLLTFICSSLFIVSLLPVLLRCVEVQLIKT